MGENEGDQIMTESYDYKKKYQENQLQRGLCMQCPNPPAKRKNGTRMRLCESCLVKDAFRKKGKDVSNSKHKTKI